MKKPTANKPTAIQTPSVRVLAPAELATVGGGVQNNPLYSGNSSHAGTAGTNPLYKV